MGTVLGVGISNLINTFNPQCIILGGGVSKAADFSSQLHGDGEAARLVRLHQGREGLRLERGEVLGAAALVLQQLFSTGQIVRGPAGDAARAEAAGRRAAQRPARKRP